MSLSYLSCVVCPLRSSICRFPALFFGLEIKVSNTRSAPFRSGACGIKGEATPRKIDRRVEDEFLPSSVPARLLLYKGHAASLMMYKAQFAETSRLVLRAAQRALQNTLRASWQVNPEQALQGGRVPGQPVEAPDLAMPASTMAMRKIYSVPKFHMSRCHVSRMLAFRVQRRFFNLVQAGDSAVSFGQHLPTRPGELGGTCLDCVGHRVLLVCVYACPSLCVLLHRGGRLAACCVALHFPCRLSMHGLAMYTRL